LPYIHEIDDRFLALRRDRLSDGQFVSASIHFPPAEVSAGALWKGGDRKLVLWERSKRFFELPPGLPRNLSDRLIFRYLDAEYLTIRSLYSRPSFTITLSRPFKQLGETPRVLIRNESLLAAEEVNGFDALTYLLWYYNLGEWTTPSGECPLYTDKSRDATLLRCKRPEGYSCAYNGEDRDAVYWPPVLKFEFY